MADDTLYVLVDRVRDREGCTVFWRPRRESGYTIFLSRAGLFTGAEVAQITASYPGCYPVPYAVAEAASVKVVPDGVLRSKGLHTPP